MCIQQDHHGRSTDPDCTIRLFVDDLKFTGIDSDAMNTLLDFLKSKFETLTADGAESSLPQLRREI